MCRRDHPCIVRDSSAGNSGCQNSAAGNSPQNLILNRAGSGPQQPQTSRFEFLHAADNIYRRVRFFSGLEKSMIFGSKVCPLSSVSRPIYTSTSSHFVGCSCLVAYWCQKEEQRTETLLRKLHMVRKRHFSLYFFGVCDFSGRNVKFFSAAGSPFQDFPPGGKDAINDALSIPQGGSA